MARRTKLQIMIDALIDSSGGVRKAARFLSVHHSTVMAYSSGRIKTITNKPDAFNKINDAYKISQHRRKS